MTNTYTKAKGSFSVTNTATGAPVGDKEFTFTYTCDNGQKGDLKVKADGTAVNGPELPVGTECTIEQDVNKAQVDGYSLKAPASQKVTIGEKMLDLKFAGMYTSLAVPTPTPSADATAEPSAEPSAAPSAAPADKPAADAKADPNAKPSADATATPSAEATTEPTAEETATPSASAGSDVNEDPNADAYADPDATPSASSSATASDLPSGADQQVTPTSPAAPAPADGAPSGSAGGPLASTGVRIGLPLGIAVVAVMGGALLVSRRRA